MIILPLIVRGIALCFVILQHIKELVCHKCDQLFILF